MYEQTVQVWLCEKAKTLRLEHKRGAEDDSEFGFTSDSKEEDDEASSEESNEGSKYVLTLYD